MTNAAIYVRISRDREGAGLGVERQRADCEELAARLGITVAGVYCDNDISASGRKPRPEYLRMLADIKDGRIGAVVAWHADRLHRSPIELENYIATCELHGVLTHTVQAGPIDLATPAGQLVARQLGAVARYEIDNGAKRIRRKKQEIAVSGKWAGGRRPYGYESDGVTVRPDEARVVADAADSILLGSSLRAQSAKLNAAGRRTSTGRQWQPSELKKVLLRARNAGLREHRGEVIGKAAWPAIVAEEKWRAVRVLLTDPARRTNAGAAPRWLLSGVARCGVCGDTVIITRPTGASVPSYTCRAAKHVVRNASELDEYVAGVMRETLRHPAAAKLLRPAAPDIDVAALNAEETNLQERLDALADDLGLDERTLARRSQRLRARLEEIGVQKALAGRGSAFSDVADAPDRGAAWDRLDRDRQRALVELFVTITINRARKGRRSGWRAGESYFDHESVEILPTK